MGNATRLLVGMTASVALTLTTAPLAHAAVDPGSVWAGPTRLETAELRFGDFRGNVHAHRVGLGPNSTAICVEFQQATSRRDGTTRYDHVAGCQSKPGVSGYSFAPARWKGAVSAVVPVESWSSVQSADGTVTATKPTPATVHVDLRWTGTGAPVIRHNVRTYFLMPYASATATKRANVNGQVRIGGSRIVVSNATGTMQTGL